MITSNISRQCLLGATIICIFLTTGLAEEQLNYRSVTKRFDLKSDVSKEMCNDIGKYLEKLWDNFEKIFKWKMQLGKYRYNVMIYKNKGDYDDFLMREGFKSFNSQFEYLFDASESQRNKLVVHLLPNMDLMKDRIRNVAFRMYIRHFIEYPPNWIVYGLGYLFQSLDYNAEKGFALTIPRGYIREWREAILCLDNTPIKGMLEYVPVLDIIKCTSDRWQSMHAVAVFESWGICLFMMEGGEKKYREMLLSYCKSLKKELSSDINADRAFKSTLSRMDFANMEKELIAYISGLVQPGNEYYLKGIELSNRQEYKSAIDELTRAIDADPGISSIMWFDRDAMRQKRKLMNVSKTARKHYIYSRKTVNPI